MISLFLSEVETRPPMTVRRSGMSAPSPGSGHRTCRLQTATTAQPRTRRRHQAPTVGLRGVSVSARGLSATMLRDHPDQMLAVTTQCGDRLRKATLPVC